jgi:glycosyltransferase involved in cell wall biosynthesis
MRVGFLLPQILPIGGAEPWLIALLKGLADHVELVGAAVVSSLPLHPGMTGVIARYCPVFTGPDAVSKVVPRCEVLVTWGTQHRLDGYIEGHRPPGLKVVLVAHSIRPLCCGRGHDEKADALAAVSSVARAFFREEVRDRVEVIHPGVDPDRCVPSRPRDQLRAFYGYSPEDRVVGYLGRFAPEKNPLAVTRAVPALGPGWHAFLVGEGPATHLVEQSLDGLPYGRHLVVPTISHPGDALAVMDCLVVPSQYETYCLSAVEAWMAGVPVVMTDTGVRVEFEKQYGPLTAPIPFDPPPMALADAIKQATHPAFVGIVNKARWVAWERLNYAIAGRRWVDYLRRVLNS